MGIHRHAGTNHRVPLGAKNAAGNELQYVALFSNDDRVARVVASGDARYVIKRAGEIVDDFAFAFITPLRADHDDGLHFLAFSSHFPVPGNSHGLSGPHPSPSTTS